MEKINNNSKNLIITHIADIDGLGCAILAKLIDSEVDIILVEVGELTSVIVDLNNTYFYTNYDHVYITDLPVRNDAIALLNKNPEFSERIVHYDHHQSEVRGDIPEYLNVIPKKGDVLTCGTSLFHEYLLNTYPENEAIRTPYVFDFVEAVRSYDTWDWAKNGNQKGKQLTDLLSIFEAKRFIEKYYDEIIENKTEEVIFSKIDQTFLDIRKTEIANYIEECDKSLLTMKLNLGLSKNYLVGITFAQNFRSELGNALSKKHPELDFIMILNQIRNSASLRTAKEDVNVGEIAKLIHPDAGGQTKAAGFPIDNKTAWLLTEVNENKYEKKLTK